jgi:IS6 family transposase
MLLLASSVCGLFKWRQFEPEVILLAVSWYLRFSLSYRDVEELLAERGLQADHVTVWRWVQRYAPDSSGATLDFLLSAKQDAAAAKRFLAKALGRQNHPAPRVINTDGHAAYPPAVVQLKAEGALAEDCRHRPVPYLNNVLEQDHRAIKRRVNASQHFRSFWGAWRTIAGYEAIQMIRKGQACWSAASAEVGLLHHFILGLFAAMS